MRNTFKLITAVSLLLIFMCNLSNAELIVTSADYIPYSTDPSSPFKSYWLVDAWVTPDWNEVLITRDKFTDTKDGVTIEDSGKINAVVNNVVCKIPIASTPYKNLYYYGVYLSDEGYYLNLEDSYYMCKSYTGKDPVWVGYFVKNFRYQLVCVYEGYASEYNYFTLYKPESGKYSFDVKLQYAKSGSAYFNTLTLDIPEKISVSDDYIEMVYVEYEFLPSTKNYCDGSYLSNNFIFALNPKGIRLFTTMSRYNDYMRKVSSLVDDINYRAHADLITYSAGKPVYEISEDGYYEIQNLVNAINSELSDMWMDIYKIDANTQMEFGELIRYTNSPLKAHVRLRFNADWLGILRLMPDPKIESIYPSKFEMDSYQSKDIKVTISNSGSDGNVILRITGCNLIELADPTSVYIASGDTKTFDVTVSSGSVDSDREVTCSLKVCDPSETNCDSKQFTVKIHAFCKDQCVPGQPYCKGNAVVECVWDSEKRCYREVYHPCEVACEDGKCIDQPPTVCGNGICEVGETQYNCPADCKGPVCGNRVCEPGETPDNCPIDCKTPGPDWKTKLIIALIISILILILIIKLLLRRR